MYTLIVGSNVSRWSTITMNPVIVELGKDHMSNSMNALLRSYTLQEKRCTATDVCLGGVAASPSAAYQDYLMTKF